MKATCGAVPFFALFLAAPVQAQDRWDAINDALFVALTDRASWVEGEDLPVDTTQLLWDSMATAGNVTLGEVELPLGHDGAGPLRVFDTHTVTLDGSELTVLSGGVDGLPGGLFLRLGESDHAIPGLRGSLGNCSEVTDPNCQRLDYSRSSSLTLGLASCLCEGPAVDLGAGMLGLSCYFGRGGSYLNYAIGYGPLSPEILSLFVDDPEHTARRQVCRGTDDAHRYPKFLLQEMDDEVAGVPVPGVEASMPATFIAAQVDDHLWGDHAPSVLLRSFRKTEN